jgi:hypothetical protein
MFSDWILSILLPAVIYKLGMFLALLALFFREKGGALLTLSGRAMAGFHSNC